MLFMSVCISDLDRLHVIQIVLAAAVVQTIHNGVVSTYTTWLLLDMFCSDQS
jgi:hypothetical protein